MTPLVQGQSRLSDKEKRYTHAACRDALKQEVEQQLLEAREAAYEEALQRKTMAHKQAVGAELSGGAGIVQDSRAEWQQQGQSHLRPATGIIVSKEPSPRSSVEQLELCVVFSICDSRMRNKSKCMELCRNKLCRSFMEQCLHGRAVPTFQATRGAEPAYSPSLQRAPGIRLVTRNLCLASSTFPSLDLWFFFGGGGEGIVKAHHEPTGASCPQSETLNDNVRSLEDYKMSEPPIERKRKKNGVFYCEAFFTAVQGPSHLQVKRGDLSQSNRVVLEREFGLTFSADHCL